jgi:hypothetical protein
MLPSDIFVLTSEISMVTSEISVLTARVSYFVDSAMNIRFKQVFKQVLNKIKSFYNDSQILSISQSLSRARMRAL